MSQSSAKLEARPKTSIKAKLSVKCCAGSKASKSRNNTHRQKSAVLKVRPARGKQNPHKGTFTYQYIYTNVYQYLPHSLHTMAKAINQRATRNSQLATRFPKKGRPQKVQANKSCS